MSDVYTPKQLQFMRMWQRDELKRINLLEGSVSSGKTWISLVAWAFWVKTMPNDPDALYLMSARSLTTLKRNCLLPLQSLVGQRNFTFSISSKEGYLFGRHIILEGANDAQAETKIRGVTLQGAYCDEATKLNKDFFAMILSRLRRAGAKLIATTNPDAPGHWLKTDYIDRADEIDLLVLKFLIDDNTTLPKEYVENIKKEYIGVFYERFILGNWTLAEGLIYPMYEDALVDKLPDDEVYEYCVSIDYGTMNAFAMLLWERHTDGVWYASRRYYYSGRETGVQKTDMEYLKDIENVLADLIEAIRYTNESSKNSLQNMKLPVIIDPSAASFIALLKKTDWAKVIAADNNVLDGIRETASVMYQGKIKILSLITEWKDEAAGYVWDEKEKEDKPIKVKDHCLTGDTIVMTEHGAKPIKELVGTSGNVWSYNTETGCAELKPYHDCRLTQEKAEIYEIETEDWRIIRCTGEHPILTQRGFILAKYLEVSDKIIDMQNLQQINIQKQKPVPENVQIKCVGVKSIKKVNPEPVYNMEVEDNHNFAVAGGLIVHNCMDATRYFVKTKKLAKVRREGKSLFY